MQLKLTTSENSALTTHLASAKAKLERKNEQLKGYKRVMREQESMMARISQLAQENQEMSSQLDRLQ